MSRVVERLVRVVSVPVVSLPMVAVALLVWPVGVGADGLADLATVVYYETEFDSGNFDPETQGPAAGMQGLSDVVATPDGKHLYASGGNDDAIARFRREAGTGLLTYLGTTVHAPPGGALLDGVRKLAVSPDSKHLYATAILSNAVTVFVRVEATGDLAFVQALVDDQGGVSGLAGATAAAVSPDGRQVYVVSFADDAVVVFDRDATTGVLTHSQSLFDGVGGVDGLDSADDVVVSPDGEHVYVVSGKSLPNLTQGDDAIAVFARDTDPISPTFGKLTFLQVLFDGVGGVNGLHEVQNVDISGDGRHVYTAAETDAAIGSDPNDDWLAVFSRDTNTGLLTFVETPGSVARPECGITFFSSTTADVEVGPGGAFVYVTDPRENTLVELVRSSTTGRLSNARATCRGAKRDGTDFENELASGLLNPTALALVGGDVVVGGFSPAAVSVFGTPSVIEIGKDAIPDDPQDFEFDIEWTDPRDGLTSVGPTTIDDDIDPTLPINPVTVGPFEPGDYAVVERPVSGWTLSAIDCTDPSGGTTTDVPDRKAQIALGLGETVSCVFTNVAVQPSDSDSDGVDGAEEDGAPNGGDGNGDGTQDSAQPNVASLVSTTGSYLTLVVDPRCTLSDVVAIDPAALPPDPGRTAPPPQGLLGFRLAVGGECPQPVTAQVLYHGENSLAGYAYRKYGPEPGNLADHWFSLTVLEVGVISIGGDPSVATMTIQLVDGGPGDSTIGAPDGVIVDPGGPVLVGTSAFEIPTLSEWALLLLAGMLAGLGSWMLWRR